MSKREGKLVPSSEALVRESSLTVFIYLSICFQSPGLFRYKALTNHAPMRFKVICIVVLLRNHFGMTTSETLEQSVETGSSGKPFSGSARQVGRYVYMRTWDSMS